MTIKMTETEYHEHARDNDGVCMACEGITCGGVEPDAESYYCEDCGESAVIGIETAMLSGLIQIVE